MLTKTTQKALPEYFERLADGLYWPSDIAKIFSDNRSTWKAKTASNRALLDFVLEVGLLQRTEFVSPKYKPIVRYLKGHLSSYNMAINLRKESYLSHHSALVCHGILPPLKDIYANQEQSTKDVLLPEPTQASITAAFKRPQRKSNYVFEHDGKAYVLLNGKQTNNAGVEKIKTHLGEILPMTTLERTLIDIVVRPFYGGGIANVIAAYRAAASRVDVHKIVQLIRDLDYVYPYQQSIGFLLECSGRGRSELFELEATRSDLDFFLDYGTETAEYDAHWRLYYPSKFKAQLRP
jgi:hypothetical protein